MAQLLLVTKADFAPYVEISSNIDEAKKLNTHIEHAQEFDLRPLLGDLLFYDLLKNHEQQMYIDLISGKEYLVEGIDISFSGLKPVIVHFTAARLVQNGNGMITATGFRDKRHDLSDPVDPREIARVSNMYESLALGYWNKVKAFLDVNSDQYPIWKTARCGVEPGTRRTSGARIYGLGLNHGK